MTQARHAHVVILGSGPAGYTAAIYLLGGRIEPQIVLEGDAVSMKNEH
jgi:thioredoxin reductase